MRKKILVDIDVIAVALHYVNDNDYSIAGAFLKRIETAEFELYITYSLLDLVEAWRSGPIKEKILDFYKKYFHILPAIEIEAASIKKGIQLEEIAQKISKNGIKPEDASIAVITSLFSFALVTLNRKHLRNRRNEINKMLKERGLDEIDILLPNEI